MNYVHHIPGRLRVRSAAIRRNEGRATAVRALLEGTPGVHAAEANPLTGSIMIRYDTAQTNGEALITTLREWGFAVSMPEPRRSHVPATNQIGSALAKHAAKYLVETAAEKAVIALVAAML